VRSRLEVGPADESAWRAALAATPRATFFQTPDWWSLAPLTAKGFRVRCLELALGEERHVWPLLERKAGRWPFAQRELRGNAAGTYAMPLGPGSPSPAFCAAAARWMQGHARTGELRPNPFATIPSVDWGSRRDDATQVVDLAGGIEAVRQRYSRGHRSNIRSGQHQGVVVAPAEGPDDWNAYYAIYEDSIDRWGSAARRRYPFALFHALADLPQGPVRLWLAKVGDQVAAGAVVLTHGDTCVYWHGATARAFFEHRPSNVLHDAIMDHAAASGCGTYDMQPSGGLEGVMAFKRGFGAQSVSSPVYTWKR